MNNEETYENVNRIQELYLKLNFCSSIINNTVKWGALVLIFWLFYKSIAALSGKNTETDILVKFIGQFSINEYLMYLFSLSGISYGLFERRLRKSKVKKLSDRIKKLELLIDKNRTSSNLNPEGELNDGEQL